MERQKRFAVIGSDARQLAAGRALARAGYAVEGPEEIALADYILLPLPLDAARTPLAELLRAARPGALALGGMLSEEAKAIAAEAGVELVDYFAREELTIRNAIPTAEGCIGVLLAQRKRTLWGSAVLLLGFGPVGQAVGTRLAALGAHVTVAARRPAQRAQAESLGMQGAELARLARLAPAFDTVVNTIPAQVLTAPVLARLRPQGHPCIEPARCLRAGNSRGDRGPDGARDAARKGGSTMNEKRRCAFAVCGSFCTLETALEQAQELTARGWELLPVMSNTAARCDTRFGRAGSWRQRLEALTGHPVLDSLQAVEPLGPKNMAEALVIAPCTGSTLARLAAGLSDTPVTLAAKSLLRVGRPVVIAVSTNDGLGASGENIARLYQRKHYYFVPYGQDDPQAKPQSLKARFALLPAALDAALEGRQLQPVLCPAAGHGMSFQQGKSVVY